MFSLDDTIAAVATAPGEGAIAVVRLSGDRARGLGRALLGVAAEEEIDGLEPWRACVRQLRDPASGQVLDEVLLLWMPGPRSYTREDVLELHCHGGYTAADRVLRTVLRCGARLAEPGEFTLRAYLGGRLDLVQAEAVLDVIQARSEVALETHEDLLAGALSVEVGGWQEELATILAQVEAYLDFAEEEVGELDRGILAAELARLAGVMEGKLRTYDWGRRTRDGYTVVLAGAPNTGKSSLLNALLAEERAIVSAVPGTTRDVIDAWCTVAGVGLRLVDTAGLREAVDSLEQEGVKRARTAVGGADLVLFVADGSRTLSRQEGAIAAEVAQRGAVLPVVNKVDLGTTCGAELAKLFGTPPLHVSATRGDGMEQLLSALAEAARGPGAVGGETPLTRQRHRQAVEQALGHVGEALSLVESNAFLDAVAGALHAARTELRALLGWGAPEDVLERVFSEFCIGK